MHFTIHGDGGSRGNPGPSGAGATIHDAKGELVATVSQFLGTRTNNFAEYEAVILALETLFKILKGETSKAEVSVKMDSELVVKQMKKIYKVKHPALKEQNARLTKAMEPFGKVTFTHVYREENGEADALANEAMDRGA
ncbi:MAG: rnhA [Parcubacteria group bacterium]|nr:rnhA [Parcubacteria group bacterium]